jgi:N-acetylglutamate synthase-like GNAT family acetyltransferase
MDVELGPAREADLPAVEALVREAYEPYVPRIGRPPAPLLVDYAAVIAEGRAVVARRGRVVGLLVSSVREDHVLVENLAVASEARGSGVGALLLEAAEEQARAAGVPELRLYTNERMHENLSYYPRRGFAETGRAVQDGFARVFFARPVSPAGG